MLELNRLVPCAHNAGASGVPRVFREIDSRRSLWILKVPVLGLTMVGGPWNETEFSYE